MGDDFDCTLHSLPVESHRRTVVRRRKPVFSGAKDEKSNAFCTKDEFFNGFLTLEPFV